MAPILLKNPAKESNSQTRDKGNEKNSEHDKSVDDEECSAPPDQGERQPNEIGKRAASKVMTTLHNTELLNKLIGHSNLAFKEEEEEQVDAEPIDCAPILVHSDDKDSRPKCTDSPGQVPDDGCCLVACASKKSQSHSLRPSSLRSFFKFLCHS